MSIWPGREEFLDIVRRGREAARGPDEVLAVPLGVRLMGDQLTPVLVYRRLVVHDERTDPSFLLESVEGGQRIGRYSLMGAQPLVELIARGHEIKVRDRRAGAPAEALCGTHADPLAVAQRIIAPMRLLAPAQSPRGRLPACFLGGWVGYAGYDTVRYAEPEKLPLDRAPRDDRNLPDLALGLYDRVVIFDHVETLVHAVRLAMVGPGDDPGVAYDKAAADLRATSRTLQMHSKPLPSGELTDAEADPAASGAAGARSNMTPAQHASMVEQAKAYIRAGDVFQVVLGQRFERASTADPFDVYRALRAINPSPYRGYLQTSGCILVASSPEILCRVRRDPRGRLIVTNRPLAGTRRRGATHDDDLALERELLADAKERAEHVMLVDLGRNDVGRVAKAGSVRLPALMEIERYSHVMHISSTVEGEVREGLGCWDALRASLPAGTISGAPKVRAMQVIDELEPARRGPYGGGFGCISLAGEMDFALTLRTMVVPTALRQGSTWTYHIQAAGGIVADSQAQAEYQETVNKAAALQRAIDVAEGAFASPEPQARPASPTVESLA